MYTNEDQKRLLESRHDIAAAENPALLSADTHFKAALTKSRTLLASRRAALLAAAETADRERSETDTERLNLQRAVELGVRWYAFILTKASAALLEAPPNAPILQDELARRQKLLNRVFSKAPSDFTKMGSASAIEVFGSVATALSTEPELTPLGFAADMATAHANAEQAAKRLNRETDEDSAAMNILREARADFDRCHQGHARLVEGILLHEGKEGELGRYILAKDPAYAARRSAQAPISEEPGVETGGAPPANTTP